MHLLLLLSSAAPIIGHTIEHDIGSVLYRILILNDADWPDRQLLGRRR